MPYPLKESTKYYTGSFEQERSREKWILNATTAVSIGIKAEIHHYILVTRYSIRAALPHEALPAELRLRDHYRFTSR